MFEQLSDRLLQTIKRFRSASTITEGQIEETLKELRLGLLEADVNFKVVKHFLEQVKQKALGQQLNQGLSAREQFLKIVHDELLEILGKEASLLDLKENPSFIMLVGLQGAGKTTTAAKLALYLRQKLRRKAGLVPLDFRRPGAIEQLEILGRTNQIPVFPTQSGSTSREVLNALTPWQKQEFLDVVILDTAGRLHVDEELMEELVEIKSFLKPQETLLVVDSQLGQQSISVAQAFHQKLHLTGLILTKVDGDARGGAALSIRHVTQIPIKFLGLGEKVAALEVYHPDRLVKRLLDMGDIMTLVEKAQEVVSQKEQMQTTEKLVKGQLTLEDFLQQLRSIKRLGGLETILKYLPGFGEIKKQLQSLQIPDQELKKIEAIILSMTPEERRNPKILNGSRRSRIARGSGTKVQDVNRLVNQFEQAQKMMSSFLKGKGPLSSPFMGGKR